MVIESDVISSARRNCQLRPGGFLEHNASVKRQSKKTKSSRNRKTVPPKSAPTKHPRTKVLRIELPPPIPVTPPLEPARPEPPPIDAPMEPIDRAESSAIGKDQPGSVPAGELSSVSSAASA